MDFAVSVIPIPGYIVTEQIYIGSRTLVYRGIREADSTPVAIKLLVNEYPRFSELVQFRNQYTIAKNLELPGVIKSYSLEPYRNSYALVMEDFGGISLTQYVKERRSQERILPIKEFLEMAINLTNTINEIHHKRIIHKDIKPDNILINPETKQVKFIDFSISSLLPKESQELQNPNILEGTLAYLSPEQTGRMNRGIDYRTDFYSLGITFFEILTGELPFPSNDPMELVHCHIAKEPPFLHNINPDIPPILSNIITKLMAKNAEDRYQSAIGLKYDLEKCLIQWQETGIITTFPLSQRDLSDRFIIPEKLYGRQREVETLLSAFERVAQGSTELMLVAGFSGIGKTAVVNEVHKPIVRQRGYFIKGKFDQFNRNIPFSAFLQAFRDLMGQLLSESDSQLQKWKEKILEAVGENGQVIIEVIPELELLMGKQPPVVELSGSAVQNRFNLLLQNFVQVFTQVEHPLVIFLDDLQWADSASLKLLEVLMNDAGYLLILGAYRDNEVSPVHPFILTVNELEKTGATVNTLTLEALSQKDINQLVADTLSCDRALAQPLTELVNQKTKGNPFFTTQFLKALHEDKFIHFNPDAGYWECEISQVKAQSLTDDVVEFMALQLQKLPQETQQVLKLAACIGNQFDLESVAIISEKSEIETAAVLWNALQEGLIIPLNETYKFFQEDTGDSRSTQTITVPYRFLHDRVQQAAYSLIPKDNKSLIHLKIGQLLLNQTLAEQLEEKIFVIVSQLNQGIDQISSQDEYDNLARLNLLAGGKARLSSAYEAAAQYCERGLKLLAHDVWIKKPNLARGLFIEAASCACLIGQFERVDELTEVILQNIPLVLDKVKAVEVQIQSLIARNRLSEAIKIARGVLSQLDVELPENPTQEIRESAFNEVHQLLAKTENVTNLRPMSDPQKLAAMSILSSMASAAYIGSPALYPLIVLKQVELSLRFGNTLETAYAYSTYGLILCAFGGEIEAGNHSADVALTLMAKFQCLSFKAKIFNLIYPFVRIWKEPIRNSMGPLLTGYQAGLESGDLEFAAYCAYNHCQLAYFASENLLQLEQDMQSYSDAISKLKQTTALNFHQIVQQAVLNWTGKTEYLQYLLGDVYNENERLPQHQAAGDTYSIGTVYVHKLILTYHFGQPQEALAIAQLAQEAIGGVAGTVNFGIFYFYHGLTLLATIANIAENSSLPVLDAVEKDLDQLSHWSNYAPENFAHKCDLIRAEKSRILEQKADAIELYDKAISGAKKNKYIQEEALANELAAKFYLNWGKEKVAAGYMQEAYYCYSRWGAKAKIIDLEKHYPKLLAPILQPVNRPSLNSRETLTKTLLTLSSNTSSNSISGLLDVSSILKIAQSFYSEIHLEQLVAQIMQVVVENAGADKGALILNNNGSLEVMVKYLDGQVYNFESKPLDSCLHLPLSIIYYVEHTLENITSSLDIPATFAADPYLAAHPPQSLVCTPIVKQGKLIGILYLENALIANAFTSERVELLKFLCTQAAISIENASLYQQAQQTLTDLKQAQLQIVQSEKMSALGNLVAGVAHEINNPVGFLAGNIQLAIDYVKDLFGLLDLYEEKFPDPGVEVEKEIETIELEYIREDLPKLIGSMTTGVDRIRDISNSLRTFSRADSDRPVAFNIHEGLDSVILILKHRLKANESRSAIVVVKNYGELPMVKCYAGQLNQVFMNILANGIDALEESNRDKSYKQIEASPNCITISTEVDATGKSAIIRIQDNGMGMSDEVKNRIFDHLFTTKAVGKGTGLGMAISRQIVVEKHKGSLEVNSKLGDGAEFVIKIPV